MTSITIHQDGTYAGQGTISSTGRIECDAVLGPEGLDHQSGEQQDAAERAYDAIESAIADGETSVTVDGVEYTWAIGAET